MNNRVIVIHRCANGGGQIWFLLPDGTRDLVADLYGPEERQARIIGALRDAGILPNDATARGAA